MFFCHKQLMIYFLAFLLVLSIFDINPFIIIALLTFVYVIVMGSKQEWAMNSFQKPANLSFYERSVDSSKTVYPFEKHLKSFIELIPVVSYPQKKIVFYHCRLYHPHRVLNEMKDQEYSDHRSFFECLKFLSTQQKMDKNICYILDLNAFVLNDETYFDLFLYHLQNNTFKKDHIIFSIDYQVMQDSFYKIMDLCKFDLNFNVYNIPVDQIENILTGELGSHIYSCQVSQSKLIDLMRDELMNEKMHSFHGYMARLMVTDIEDPEDINALPNIVDYVCGKAFAKSLTIAV